MSNLATDEEPCLPLARGGQRAQLSLARRGLRFCALARPCVCVRFCVLARPCVCVCFCALGGGETDELAPSRRPVLPRGATLVVRTCRLTLADACVFLSDIDIALIIQQQPTC